MRHGKSVATLPTAGKSADAIHFGAGLRKSGGWSIRAHEAERKRLARELHDGVAQGLALLALDLFILPREFEHVPKDVRERLAALSARANALGSELYRVSRGLHPSALEQLGLEAAIRRFCTDFSRARGLTVDIVAAGVGAVPNDVALCLYRVAQEALHNVVKHSGASHASVTLSATQTDVSLSVKDQGAGFDTRAALASPSLGLRSMRERASLVNGRVVVHSSIGEGTEINVRVPIGSRELCVGSA